ncbi:hypothetical protein [Variovorax boronicumulans]
MASQGEHKAICVFTARGRERIFSEGGSKAWVLDSARAARIAYVVCVQNRGFSDDWGEVTAPAHAAFLVGKLDKVVEVPNESSNKSRYLLTFSEYAEIEVPDAWPGFRNPVWYTTLEEMNIDVSSLRFKPMPKPGSDKEAEAPLTIAEAKRRLALHFGVEPDDIEITVRG